MKNIWCSTFENNILNWSALIARHPINHTPRASCHSLSYPCTVFSLIRARSKRKMPDARRVWNAPTARRLMIPAPSKVQICVNPCKSVSKKIITLRASCHSLSCPCAVFSLIRARTKRKTPTAPIGTRRSAGDPKTKSRTNSNLRKSV